MKKNGKILGDVIQTVTIAVLFLVILLLVVFSAMSYQRSVEIQEDNNNTRALLSYVITAVKANEAGTVTIEERGGIPMLVIADTVTGYEQQIYQSEGKVYESYARTGAEPDPSEALEIGESSRVELTWMKEDLLQIRTDKGNSYVHIRS